MKRFNRTALIALLAASAVSTDIALAQPPNPNDPNAPPSWQQQDRGRGGRPGDNRWDRDRDRGDRWDRGRRAPSPRQQVGFFYDELSPYGEWVLTRQYGWAWYPTDVAPYWRPYSDGRWTYTDYGWTWASYEPFGWATYHYGRWGWDDRFGWLWVPGRTWGPAWVSWQTGNGYIGWAPLPPEVGFDLSFGIRLGDFNLSVGFEPDNYLFVPERYFLDSRLTNYYVAPSRNAYILRNTRNVTQYESRNSRVMNRGIDVRRIEDVTGKPVRRMQVTESRNPRGAEIGERELKIYRPDQQELDSVAIGDDVDQGLRTPPPPPQGWDPGPQQRQQGGQRDQQGQAQNPGDWGVAPRVNPPRAPFNAAKQAEEERKELADLQRYQIEEKNRLDKQQKEELGKAKAPAQRSEIEQRQKAEAEALRQDQIKASEQLKARQAAQREALQAPPANDNPPNQR